MATPQPLTQGQIADGERLLYEYDGEKATSDALAEWLWDNAPAMVSTLRAQAERIDSLKRKLDSAQLEASELAHDVERHLALVAECESERDAALADAQRFVWWFGDGDKTAFVADYLVGVHGMWTLDQWRTAIDKAMGGVTQT